MSVAVQGRYHYGGVAINVELLNGIDVTACGSSLTHHVSLVLASNSIYRAVSSKRSKGEKIGLDNTIDSRYPSSCVNPQFRCRWRSPERLSLFGYGRASGKTDSA